MTKLAQNPSPAEAGQYEAITHLVLEKPGNPASRREIEAGQAFDATDEELRNLTRDRDYKSRQSP